MLSKYFFATGLVGLLFLLFNLIYFGFSSYKSLELCWIIIPVIFLFESLYGPCLNRKVKVCVKSILGIFSVWINLPLVLILTLWILSFPKGKLFNEKNIISPAPQIEQEAYYHLLKFASPGSNLLDSFCYKQGKKSGACVQHYDFMDPEIQEVLSVKCVTERTQKIKFIGENITSIPFNSYDGLNIIDKDIDLPNYPFFKRLLELELTDIAQHVHQGNRVVAQRKYIYLWKVTQTSLEGQQRLVTYMIAMGMLSKLSGFFEQYASDLKLEHNEELLNIIQNIIAKLDASFVSALVGEYACMKHLVLSSAGENYQFNDERIASLILFCWGIIYDEYKTMKLWDDYYYEFSLLAHQPMYKTEDLMEPLKKLTNQLSSPFNYFINPMGKTLFLAGLPEHNDVIKYISKKEIQKSRAIAIAYLLNASDPNNPNEIPIDNLTGLKYRVSFSGNKHVIESQHKTYNVYFKKKKNNTKNF